jgi:prolyl oligopeptidase
MKTTLKIFIFFLNLFFVSNTYSQWNYPPSRTVDSTETYFGETISDPYQWLENLESTEVTDWFQSEADYCEQVISKIPNRDKLVQEMTDLDNIKEVYYSSIKERGGRYFFNKRLKGEEISKLYYRDGIHGSDILLFDPQNYEPGKNFTLGGYDVSDDGKEVLLDITENGKEVSFIRILKVDTKTLYPDEIETASVFGWLEGSDNTFIYEKYQGDDVHKMETLMDMKIMIHTVGENNSGDKEILSRVHDLDLKFAPSDYPYIVIYNNCNYMFAGKGTVDPNQELYIAPKSELLSGKINWKQFCSKGDEITSFIGYGDDVYLLTSKNAPDYKIIKTSLKNPDIQNAKLILSGDGKAIESFDFTKDYLIITQMHNGIQTYISKMNFKDDIAEAVEMPLNGTINMSPYSPFSNECVVYNSNWTTPSNFYNINLENNSFDKGAFNIKFEYPEIENIIAEEVEVPSHDGVMVPLTIIYDKTKVNKDGSNICYMNGYGAYGNIRKPGFSVSMLPMIHRGVVYAVAHVRGGGEKGEAWYRAGWKTTKPNTWKDFIACGEYLVNNGYTSKDKLAGTGGSAGGILIGRAITERPDLFRVAVPQVGSMNPLRMEFSPNGPVNIPEFGTVTIEEEFKALKEMDSYQHLEKGVNYPATLITTGFNDPRVISWVPAKFAAKMQNVNSSANPVLLHVDYSTGHFGGETMSDRFKNLADIYSFIMWQCGNPDFQPKAN